MPLQASTTDQRPLGITKCWPSRNTGMPGRSERRDREVGGPVDQRRRERLAERHGEEQERERESRGSRPQPTPKSASDGGRAPSAPSPTASGPARWRVRRSATAHRRRPAESAPATTVATARRRQSRARLPDEPEHGGHDEEAVIERLGTRPRLHHGSARLPVARGRWPPSPRRPRQRPAVHGPPRVRRPPPRWLEVPYASRSSPRQRQVGSDGSRRRPTSARSRFEQFAERARLAVPAVARAECAPAPSRPSGRHGAGSSTASVRSAKAAAPSAVSSSTPGRRAQALRGDGGHDHGARHRHGLENLVLHAARDPQRSHDGRGVLQVRTHVVDRARHHDPRIGRERAHRGAWDSCRRRRTGRRAVAGRCGQDLAREPRDGVDVRPVVHRAGEHDRRTRPALNGDAKSAIRSEEVAVDAVLDHVHARRALGREAAEQPRLGAPSRARRPHCARPRHARTPAGARPRAGTPRTAASGARPHRTSTSRSRRRRGRRPFAARAAAHVLRHRRRERHGPCDALRAARCRAPTPAASRCGSTAGSRPRRTGGRRGSARARDADSSGTTQASAHHCRRASACARSSRESTKQPRCTR